MRNLMMIVLMMTVVGCATGNAPEADSGCEHVVNLGDGATGGCLHLRERDGSILGGHDSGLCEDWSVNDCYVQPKDQPTFPDCNIVGYDVALPNEMVKSMLLYYRGTTDCGTLYARFDDLAVCVRAWYAEHQAEIASVDRSMCR